MKIARYLANGKICYGLLEGDRLTRLAGSPFESLATTRETDGLADVRLLAPVEPARIFGVGLNYKAHIEEGRFKAPTIPMLFMKPATAVIGLEDDIVYPREGKEVHYEGELAVVIGHKARRVPRDEALKVVLGFTCANDVSERPIQYAEMGMGCLLIGKGFDTFCPLGPVIATGLDPANLDLRTRVNGKQRQSSNTSDLLFPVAHLVSYISQAITLLPGDVIITGTPAGAGPIQPGDAIEVEISGIGTLRNAVVAEA